MKRKRQRKWFLLYRHEGAQKVWVYEQLRKKELNTKLRHGWKVI